MKKFALTLTILFLLIPKATYSQKGEGIAAAAGIIAGVAAAAIAIEQVKEEMELFATDYIIENYDLNAFELKINGLADKAKSFDPSSVSVLSFNITPIDYEYGNEINSERIALLVFLDSGWKNEFGIDITKVKFTPFDKEKWNGLFGSYVGLASGAKITDGKVPVYKKTNNPKSENVLKVDGRDYEATGEFKSFKYVSINRKGVENSNSLILPFKRITGDTYFVEDYSDEFKIIFNEKSLGLYLKEVGRLVQIKRSLVDDITDFLNI